jgi:hypothetical protein
MGINILSFSTTSRKLKDTDEIFYRRVYNISLVIYITDKVTKGNISSKKRFVGDLLSISNSVDITNYQ